AHDFVYGALARLPGLLVLHDLVLHHGRGRMFLDSPAARAYAADPGRAPARAAAEADVERYAAEVRHAYPRQADRRVPTYLGPPGPLLPYASPLFRLPVEASRVVAVHNDFMAEAVRAEVRGAEVVRIPMPAESGTVAAGALETLRGRYGIAPGELV